MACNDVKMDGDDSVVQPGDSCYPTGCTPCTEPISFPDNPIDNQRYCIPIGSDGAQKCWVFDKCIPGWRAEGPSASPTRYRGAVNIKTNKPGFENTELEIAAGDWYIQSIDATSPYLPEWGLQLGDTVSAGDRIAYSGTQWQKLQPPSVEYAEEARDGDVPDPDDRRGGIVKNATVNQALAGTNKCDSITPYTLQKKLDEDLVDFTPTKPQTVTATIKEGNDVKVCVNNKILKLTVEAEATTEGGVPALGRFVYQWIETTSGTDVELDDQETDQLMLDPYEATPSTLKRKFKCKVSFIDLFNDSTVATTTETIVSLEQALVLTGQPVSLDLSGGTTSGTFTVTVEQADGELSAVVPTYKWLINNIEITGGSVPANTGYAFSNFTTNQLTVTRQEADAGTYTITCMISGGNCNEDGLITAGVFLYGPGGQAPGDVPETSFPIVGEVGSYLMVADGQAPPDEGSIAGYAGIWKRAGDKVVMDLGTNFRPASYGALYQRIS